MIKSLSAYFREKVFGAGDSIAVCKKTLSETLLSAAEIRRRWSVACAARDGEQILLALHGIETDLSDTYAWPWICWQPQDGIKDAPFPDLPTTAPEIDTAPLSDFAVEIYHQAFRVRQGDLSQIEAIHSQAIKSPDLVKTLPPVFRLELALYAFSDKKWVFLQTLCNDGLQGWSSTEMPLPKRLALILFELLLRAYVQGEMPTFVHEPAPLTEALAKLGSDVKLREALGRTSQAVGILDAARLAFGGDIRGSVRAFDILNKKGGFKTPAFSPSEVLLPVQDAAAADIEKLQSWFANYSEITHHFRHNGQGKHVFLVASEQNYMTRYGDLYAETLALTNPGSLVHFHLINMADTPKAILQMFDHWEKKFGLQINCSFETNRIMREVPDYTSGISVNTRYIYLPDYLEAYNSLTVTDIDGWVTAKAIDLSNFGDHDTLISSWIWRVNVSHWRLPWANLAGGYISFRATENTRRLADFLRKYLLSVIKTNLPLGRRIVYADQAGLFLGLQHGLSQWGHSVGFLPKGGFDQSFEQREGFRHEGKRKAMQEKLAELKSNIENPA